MASDERLCLEDGQDAVYDYCCTPCAKRQLNTEAISYCKKCCKLFCVSCSRYHDIFKKGHHLLGKDDVEKWDVVKQEVTIFECEQHPGKELELFCVDDDSLCCSICVSLNHRTCHEIKHIPDISRGIHQNPNFKSLVSDAERQNQLLQDLLDQKGKTIEKLEIASDQIKSSFKATREMMERLEKESLEELDRLQCILEEDILSHVDTARDILDKIKNLLEDIENHGKDSESFAFQAFKSCQQAMSKAKLLLTSSQSEDIKLTFTPHPSIKKLLTSLQTLGEFNVTPCLPVSRTDHVYTISSKHFYNVKTPDDKQTCFITGLCHLPNRQMVIVDHENMKIKLLSSSNYSIIDELQFSSTPWDICHIGTAKLAVTSCTKQRPETMLNFISAGNDKLIPKRTIKLKDICHRIAYHDGYLYVGGLRDMFVYTLSGHRVKHLYELNSDYLLFPFCLNDDASKIYVADFMGNFETIDDTGQQLSRLYVSELFGSSGMSLADNGTVFVSGMSSNSIYQFDCHGTQVLSTLAKASDGLSRPYCLCYDRNSCQLLIGQQNSDHLLVLKLK